MAALQQIVVVGASLAGLRTCEALRSQGFEGRLTLMGDEPHLPYDRPPLSKEVLKGDWEPEKTSLIRDQERFDALELDLRLGCRATSLDTAARTVALDDGQSVPFDGLVIATGATPVNLPQAAEMTGVTTLRTLDDCLAIRSALEQSPRVAVVGAGFIGAEVAASCRQRGLDVTMIEAMPAPLERALGADVGLSLMDAHRAEGVTVHLGVGVERLEGGERVEGLVLADGTKVAADLVVVGIGVRPATGWLEGSGVELGDGVVCDATCATNVPGIVAAGDVASWPNPTFDERMRVEHWSNAAEMGFAAAERLLAGDSGGQPFASVPFFWSDQYDIKIQSAGRCVGADESKIVSGSLEERQFVKLYARKGRLAGALAFSEPRRLIGYRRMLRKPVPWEEALAKAEA
jgi:3-phenylpropionate/trans-cinnamate dioxygenase ferredoxin reductase subunit